MASTTKYPEVLNVSNDDAEALCEDWTERLWNSGKKDRGIKITYSEILIAAIGSSRLSDYKDTIEQFLAKHPELREKLESERAGDPTPSKATDGGLGGRKPRD